MNNEQAKKPERHIDTSQCIHCGQCTKNCLFLGQYGLDLAGLASREDLAYHCFLCGKCAQVCPKEIDGRELVLEMRRDQVKENGGELKEKGYTMLVREKADYKYRNYKKAVGESVLFPGCNFPSYYPESTKKLAKLLKERAGIGVAFDCCGKPVAELGLYEEEQRLIARMDEAFEKRGIREVIMVCPNCYSFLKPRLRTNVVTIYEKLAELGLGAPIEGALDLFLPCPDRETKEFLTTARPFFREEPRFPFTSQCCGLGGCAGGKEPELAKEMQRQAADRISEGNICTYCASCSGNFARKSGVDTEHILLKILQWDEKPDTAKSMLNRMKMKYWF